MFIPTDQVHKYNTRSSSAGNFYRKYSRLNHHKNSFASVGAKIWNSIPENLRKLPKHTFKIKIKNLLFFNLEKQDSYADVDTLIGEIGKVSWYLSYFINELYFFLSFFLSLPSYLYVLYMLVIYIFLFFFKFILYIPLLLKCM